MHSHYIVSHNKQHSIKHLSESLNACVHWCIFIAIDIHTCIVSKDNKNWDFVCVRRKMLNRV